VITNNRLIAPGEKEKVKEVPALSDPLAPATFY
jgi:hypothetical protein